MSEGLRRFFSAESEAQAVLDAASALGVPPGELAYRRLEKKTGFLRRPRVVIEVDTTSPRRPAAAPVASAERPAPAAVASRPPGPGAAPAAPPGPNIEPFAAARGDAGVPVAVAALASLAGLELAAAVAYREGPDGPELRVDLRGAGAGSLLEHQGELLGATEYLLRRMVRDLPPGGLVADSGGFRDARDEELRRRATAAAEEVRRSGDTVLFEPLPAGERRIVHLAIREQAGVVSASEGEGEMRQVRVLPEPAAG